MGTEEEVGLMLFLCNTSLHTHTESKGGEQRKHAGAGEHSEK